MLSSKSEIHIFFELWSEIYLKEGIAIPSYEKFVELTPHVPLQAEWFVMEPKGVSISTAWKMCKDRFPCHKPEHDIEQEMQIGEQGRTVGFSITWLPREVSVVTDVTVRQRLLFEVFLFDLFGDSPSDTDWTICSRSLYANGDIPGVRWFQNKFSVDWVHRSLE